MVIVQLDAVQIAGLLALVVILPIYQGYRNWREHRFRKMMADARGWRYTSQGWKVLIGSTYSMAGTTTSGIVWEVKQIKRTQQWTFAWSSRNRLLPYGMLAIYPRHATIGLQRNGQKNLRSLVVGSNMWQAEYVFMTTHDILAERCFSREVELALLNWPRWPAPGCLENVIWNRDELKISGRYHNDWLTLDRIVILGTALVENAAHQ